MVAGGEGSVNQQVTRGGPAMESAGLPSTEFRPIRRTSTRRGEADEVGLDERARRVRIQAESVSEPPLGQLVRPQAQSSPCCEGASSPSRRPSLLVGGLRIVKEKSTLFLSRPCMTRQEAGEIAVLANTLGEAQSGAAGCAAPCGAAALRADAGPARCARRAPAAPRVAGPHTPDQPRLFMVSQPLALLPAQQLGTCSQRRDRT